MLCAVIRQIARSATRIAVLGAPRLGDRLGSTLAACVPQLQHLVLDVSEPSAAKGVDRALSAVGHRLRALELRVGARGTLPAVGLEDCTALEELRLVLDMHALAPLGPLRMRGDEAPPAVTAIASLGAHLSSLELLGSALPRLLDPPHRLAGLSELTALTRLRMDMPPGFLAPPAAGGGFATTASGTGGPGCSLVAVGEERAAELRWRAVPLAASLGSLAEVHLGRSYELTVYDMAVLARAPQLAVLACRNIVLPPTRGVAMAPWAVGVLSGGGAVRCGLPSAPPAVPLPPQLRELQVRRLPCAPVLAALDSLPPPGLQVFKCRAFERAVAAAAAAAAATAAVSCAGASAALAALASAGSATAYSSAGGAESGGRGFREAHPGHGGGGTPTAERAAAAAAAAITAKASSGGDGLRLAMVGSSCDAESFEADPWVADVALAAFRLIQRLLFSRAPPLPASFAALPLSQPGGAAGLNLPPPPLPARCAVVLPALQVRPFERGGGGRHAAGTTLHGPYASSWLSALAPLGAGGLLALQLRGFELGAGDLQLLRVSVPELQSCELRGCPAADVDVLRLRDWLQRPGWGGSLQSDLHGELLLNTGPSSNSSSGSSDAAAAAAIAAVDYDGDGDQDGGVGVGVEAQP